MVDRKSTSSKLAFVNSIDYQVLTESDAMLKEAFERRGYIVDIVAWDDHSTDWATYEAVIIRACWNYYLAVDDFTKWLLRLEGLQVPVWNSTSVIEWNMRKTYLKELENNNIPVIPTIFLDESNSHQIQEIMKTQSWSEAVIKPVIGASAYHVDKITSHTDLENTLQNQEMMLQPFLSEFKDGEFSFMFFNGQYSHAAKRLPSDGSFITNISQGGREVLVQPDEALIKQATKALGIFDNPLLYARVDGILVQNQLLISELEIIEPHLFIDLYPESAEHFVDAFETLQN